MSKLVVDKNTCIGCGLCASLDEEHFNINDETGLSEVISQENIDSEMTANAVSSCPVDAISIVNEEKNDN